MSMEDITCVKFSLNVYMSFYDMMRGSNENIEELIGIALFSNYLGISLTSHYTTLVLLNLSSLLLPLSYDLPVSLKFFLLSPLLYLSLFLSSLKLFLPLKSDCSHYNLYFDHMPCLCHRTCFYLHYYNIGYLFLNFSKTGLYLDILKF